VIAYDGDDLAVVYSNELDPMQTGVAVRSLLHEHTAPHIVIERFTITSATAKNSQAPWSLEVIGIVKWLVFIELGLDPDEVITMQGPAEAKRLITNDILRKCNLWHRGGQGHANDAIRHAVYRYAILGWRKPWEAEPL
jgi:hypothetical protein